MGPTEPDRQLEPVASLVVLRRSGHK